MSRRWSHFWLALLIGTLLGPTLASVVQAQETPVIQHFPVPNGRFYSEASGRGASHGFVIADEGGIPLLSEFERLGGVGTLGYPASGRFQREGFVYQATQKILLQWRPELGRSVYANTFDILSQAGRDEWLRRERMIPPPADPSADRGLTWDAIVARHLAILEASPAIRAAYLDSADPVGTYGLPMALADMGPAVVLRAQRAAFQLWRVTTPFAQIGQITIVNGGDLVKEAGLLPPEAVAPRPAAEMIVTSPGPPVRVEPAVVAVAQLAAVRGRASTVEIVAPTSAGDSQGTGIVLDARGHILTNSHVVADAPMVRVTLPDGRRVRATAVARDQLTDLAIVTAPLPADAVQPVLAGDARELRPGDRVVAIGYSPFFPSPPTTRLGTYGGFDRDLIDLIRSDSFILPGDSGGPLFDLRGRLVGVNTAIRLSDSATQPLVGFSIDLLSAQPVIADLIAQGRVNRPYLGVRGVTLTAEVAATLGMAERGGVAILAVAPGSPAAQAGLRRGDVIVALDGVPIRSTSELGARLASHAPSDQVALAIVGPGGRRVARVTLAPPAE